jgi:tetratricopeptide (TPR) repeat protein
MNEAIEELFAGAMDLAPGERESFVRLHSRGDEALAVEVLSLVSDGEKAEALLGGSVARLASCLDLDPGTRIGSYVLREKIGEGGMGVVYLADRADGQFDQRVAIKLVRGGAGITARFLGERRILARLTHPHIARLIDGGILTETQPYMVMEYFDGQPISEYCNQKSRTLRDKLRLFRTVCEAVEYAHRNLVVHRDLKPANILVNSEGEIKLLDFGIAKLLSPNTDGSSTASGMHLFTPDYASPEQIRGDEINTSTDVYSLGAVLYELLAGRSPHHLKTYTPHEMTQVICHDPAPELKLGNELDQIVAMALRKEPERRYPSVAALSEDIGRFLADHPVLARGDSAMYRTRKFVQRHVVGVIAAGLAVFSLTVGLGVAAWQASVADRRFGEVRKLARTVLFDFDDKIRDIPGGTAARDFLAKTAVEYLDNLSKEATGDMVLKSELATAYEKVADVQGEPARPNLGQRQNALANYLKALDMWRSMREDKGQDQVAIARLLLKRQTILGSKEMLDEARTVAAKAWKNEPNREDALAVLLQSEQSTGQYYNNRSAFEESIHHYREAGKLADIYAGRWPGKKAELARISNAMRLGDAWLRKGEPQAALASFELARTGNELVLARNRDDVGTLRRAFKLHLLKGDALGNPEYFHLGRTADAIREYNQAVEISTRLLKADPNNALARGDYSDATWALAVTIAETEPKRAKSLLETAVREAKAVSAKSPSTLSFLHNSANAQYALATVLRQLGERDAALEYTAEALRLHRDIAKARPKQIGLRHNLMPSLTLYLHLQLDRKDAVGAEETWKELLAVVQSVDTKAANFRGKSSDVASAYAAGARLHGAEFERASLAIWDQLERSGVSPVYLRQKRMTK